MEVRYEIPCTGSGNGFRTRRRRRRGGPAGAEQRACTQPGAGRQAAENKSTNIDVNIGGPARPSADAPAPAAPAQTETKSPGAKAQTQTDSSKDDVSALPRAASREQSTIFGLTPVTAVVIAAALLVVVILAIVAMTRSNDTYIDTNRGI
jgi:hypothetical protein